MTTTTTTRVLVVDDSPFVRRLISSVIERLPNVEVVATARDGQEGVELAATHRPDVVTLDIEMPRLDGLRALPKIRQVCDAAVLMISSLTREGSQVALRALREGAFDVIAKGDANTHLKVVSLESQLKEKLTALGQRAGAHASQRLGARREEARPAAELRLDHPDLILIGSSTGGPPVLETLVAALPDSLTAPLVIAQHMPHIFTQSLAERLNDLSNLPVYHAEASLPLHPGQVYIAPGGRQARVRRGIGSRLRLDISNEPADALYKPSVDVLFESAASQASPRTLALVLTGMGSDGCEGARPLVAAGAQLLAQDQASSAVYGMPKAVTEAGLSTACLGPRQMARLLEQAGAAPSISS